MERRGNRVCALLANAKRIAGRQSGKRGQQIGRQVHPGHLQSPGGERIFNWAVRQEIAFGLFDQRRVDAVLTVPVTPCTPGPAEAQGPVAAHFGAGWT